MRAASDRNRSEQMTGGRVAQFTVETLQTCVSANAEYQSVLQVFLRFDKH